MTSDAVAILQCLFNSIWSLFTSFHIPGTRVTPASWWMFVAYVFLIGRFLSRLSGIALGSDFSTKGTIEFRKDSVK